MAGNPSITQESLRNTHPAAKLAAAQPAWTALVDALRGYPAVENKILAARSPSGAWKVLEVWYTPKTLAARERLTIESYQIGIEEEEDPLLYPGRIDSAYRKYTLLAGTTTKPETNPHIVRHLSSLFLIEKRSTLTPPGKKRDEVKATR